MTEIEINTGNKLIGIFDGWFQKNLPKNGKLNWFHANYSTKITSKTFLPQSPDNFQYHSSWLWLMPVVEKIESCFEESIQVIIKDNRCSIEMGTQYGLTTEGKEIDVPECYSGFCDTKIAAVYSSILQFIQWYNKIKPNDN